MAAERIRLAVMIVRSGRRAWRGWVTCRCPVCHRNVQNSMLVRHLGWHAKSTPRTHAAWLKRIWPY